MASLYIVFYLSTGKQVYGVLELVNPAVLSFPHMGTDGVCTVSLTADHITSLKCLPEVGKADSELGDH